MLGIDVGKDKLVCCYVDPLSRRVCWNRSVANTRAGIAQLLEQLPSSSQVVVEPTGRYSVLVAQLASLRGHGVLLAPPRQAKAFLQSVQSRAKTDRLDSEGLALFGLACPLSPYPIKSSCVEQLDQLLSARKALSLSISRLEQQGAEMSHARRVLEEAISALKARLKAVDQEIAALTAKEPEFEGVKRLRQVPGIGPVTAAAVVSRLSSKNFSGPDQFVAYMGLDVAVVQSGSRSGERGLSRQGDAELRRLLYLSAQASLRTKDSPFKAQYKRETDKGLPTTAAICAVARKMAKLCWSMHRHGTDYDPERVYRQPASSPSDVSPSDVSPSDVSPSDVSPSDAAVASPAASAPAVSAPASVRTADASAPAVEAPSAQASSIQSDSIQSDSIQSDVRPPERKHPAKGVRSEPVRSEPVRSEPVRSEPVRSEPVRSEPVRSEPGRSREQHRTASAGPVVGRHRRSCGTSTGTFSPSDA